MTIEKRRNAIADKTAPSQAPRVPAVERPGGGPKLPGPPGVPGTERFRLLAYVKQESMVRVDKRPDETVLTWPHLLRAEFLMAGLISGLLVMTSFLIQAPLEEMANASVAGVLVPTLYLVGLAIIPYIDRSPFKAARDRKLIWIFFLCLMVGGLIVTFIGSFFRGPGWNWRWPWEGIFFNL